MNETIQNKKPEGFVKKIFFPMLLLAILSFFVACQDESTIPCLLYTSYANGYNGEYFNRPNDLTFEASGNLFFTDPKSYDKNILDGRIFFVDAKTKEVILLDDSLAFPNGINISPIDGKLYVCESVFNKIGSAHV